MCGRFALTLPKEAAIRLFKAVDALAPDAPAPPRYNIRPTERVWVVARGAEAGVEDGAAGRVEDAVSGRVLTVMRWGFVPHWAKAINDGPLLINARSETIADKPAFAKSARERRCLIPADGFYEWRAEAGRGKEPHWIFPREGGPIAFGGVWRTWRGLDKAGAETVVDTVAIVTTAANRAMAPLHERLPLVVAPEHFGLWLGEEGKGAARLMTPPDEAFYGHHAVSTRINKGGRAAPDDPGLIEPAPAGLI